MWFSLFFRKPLNNCHVFKNKCNVIFFLKRIMINRFYQVACIFQISSTKRKYIHVCAVTYLGKLQQILFNPARERLIIFLFFL